MAPPSALAALGCTWGVHDLQDPSRYFWACPATAKLPLPDGMGVAGLSVVCPTVVFSDKKVEPENGIKGEPQICGYYLYYGTHVDPNEVFGDAYAGWTLVARRTFSLLTLLRPSRRFPFVMGCDGGCPMVWQ